ncbi:MAG: recombinase family protein [Bacteroidales bacterium]|nr:recombinase family protein [Bacteroidales bacterium]
MDRTSPSNKKIAVIWTRVSTKEQADNNLSLRTQEKACRKYAVENGIEVDCIKGKTSESAKTVGKHFREMLSYVSANKRINTILVYSMDRFSRTGPEAMVTNEYLKSKGINIVSVTQPIDSNNASGTFMENILFLFSQFENNLRKDKCISGMRACLENGYWYSAPPIGYSLDKKSKEKHKLVINEIGKILSKAFLWKAWDNLSDDEILFKIRHRGMRIREKRLKEIFSNPFYCGKIRHAFLGNKIVKGKHPYR